MLHKKFIQVPGNLCQQAMRHNAIFEQSTKEYLITILNQA